MSLINQMLKDLEARRSRDLETSESLNSDISWETTRNIKPVNWLTIFIIFTLVIIFIVTGYLLWERTSTDNLELEAIKKANEKVVIQLAEAKVKMQENAKSIAREKAYAQAQVEALRKTQAKALAAALKRQEEERKKLEERKKAKALASAKKEEVKNIQPGKPEETELNNKAESIARENRYNDELDVTSPVTLKKKHHPLNSKQLAEIAYNKGYKYLQQGNMYQGKEYLRKALSLYIPHIKAREMLAGIYIKSGRLINAAELLSEGVNVVPEYPLFAKLYARVLLEQNKPQLAIRVLERGAGITDVDPDYYALLAASYQRVNEHKKSTDIYLRLVKARPQEGVWWLGLGISLEKTGKNKQALEAYQRAQKTGSLNEGLVKFSNNRVSALQEIGFPAQE